MFNYPMDYNMAQNALMNVPKIDIYFEVTNTPVQPLHEDKNTTAITSGLKVQEAA